MFYRFKEVSSLPHFLKQLDIKTSLIELKDLLTNMLKFLMNNPNECIFCADSLFSIHLKLISLLCLNGYESLKCLLSNCVVQIMFLTDFQKKNDFLNHILPILKNLNYSEAQVFFWDLMLKNNFEKLKIFYEKMGGETTILLVFKSEFFLEGNSMIEKILRFLFSLIDEDIQFKTLFYKHLVLFLDYKKKDSQYYKALKLIVKENELFSDEEFLTICDKLLKEKKNSSELLLRGFYTICKLDNEFSELLIPKIHKKSISLGKKKMINMLILGKIFNIKNSNTCMNHPHIFEDFINSINNVPPNNSECKKEFFDLYIKFCEKHCYVNEKQEKNMFMIEQKENNLLHFCKRIEEKFLEHLNILKKSDELKSYLLEKIFSSLQKNEFFVSKNFFNKLLDDVNFLLPETNEKILEFLSKVFCFHFSALFQKKNNILDNKNRIVVDNGNIKFIMADLEKKSKIFEEIFFKVLFKYLHAEKNKKLWLLYFLNHVFFSEYCENPIDYMIGLVYLLFNNILIQSKNFFDIKTKAYDEYLFKVLGSQWRIDEVVLENKKFVFLLSVFEKLMKFKLKISKILEKIQLNKENMNEKKVDFHKLSKYCDLFNDSSDANNIVFLRNFIDINKSFGKNIFENILKRCLYFTENLKEYENFQTLVFLNSGLILLLILKKYQSKSYEFSQLDGLYELFLRISLLFVKENDIIKQTSSSTASNILNHENFNLKSYAFTLILKLVLKYDNFNQIPDIEAMKKTINILIKIPILNYKQAKYVSIIYLKLDKISSDKTFIHYLTNALENLDVKNSNFSKNINVIYAFLKFDEENSNNSLYIKNQHDFFNICKLILEKPISLSKSLIISHLTINKKKIIEILYLILFKKNPKDISLKEGFFTIILDILSNFNDFSANALMADKTYLRIYCLTLVLKMISRDEIPEIFSKKLFLTLSFLCFHENVQFRKIFLKILVKKSAKKNLTFDFKYFSLFFLFTMDEDATLNFLTSNCLNKLVVLLGEKIKIALEENKKTFTSANLQKTPEYLIVYLLIILLNNPFFIGKDKNIDKVKVTKLLQSFIDFVHKNNTHQRSLIFLIIINENLKKHQPKQISISKCTDFKFYPFICKRNELKNLKCIIEDININENVILDMSRSFDFTNIESTYEEYCKNYQIVTDIFSNLIQQNFNLTKYFDKINKGVFLSFDSGFYDINSEFKDDVQVISEIDKLINKPTEKKQENIVFNKKSLISKRKGEHEISKKTKKIKL